MMNKNPNGKTGGNFKTVILGAGVSGLTVAHGLKNNQTDRNGKNTSDDYILLEKKDVPGGLATQFYSNGYWFDYGGHYFHFQDKPHVQTWLEQFCRFNTYKRKSKTFLEGRYIPFPVQFHLSHLPASLKRKIYKEMLEASEHHEKSGSGNPANMSEFLLSHFGPTLTEIFFKPFLSKYYNTSVTDLAANMDRGSIPVPDREKVVQGFTGKTFGTAGYNPIILYPAKSLRHFIANYTKPLAQQIRFDEEAVSIDIQKKRIETKSGIYGYEHLITTIPLKHLMGIIRPSTGFPGPERFRHTSTLLVNVVLKEKRKRFHWVYLAEKKFPFYRAGMYASHSHPVCYMERNITPDPSFKIDRKALSRDITYTLKELGVIHGKDEIAYFDARVIPVSYVIFDRDWHGLTPPVLEKLKEFDIHSIGRWGAWNYSSMANDIKDAMEFVEEFKNISG